MTPTPEETAWLRQAIALATDNVRAGGGPFGALVVSGGAVLSTGTNLVISDSDPTAHAEIVAIRAACQALRLVALRGCLLVASCEPCPMCVSAALWARLDRVIYAATRYDAAAAGFDDVRTYADLALPPDRRRVPFTRVDCEGAREPFTEWRRTPGRVPY